jgi:hypothetical protein
VRAGGLFQKKKKKKKMTPRLTTKQTGHIFGQDANEPFETVEFKLVEPDADEKVVMAFASGDSKLVIDALKSKIRQQVHLSHRRRISLVPAIHLPCLSLRISRIGISQSASSASIATTNP